MAENNYFAITKLIFSNHVCHCGAVVKKFLARADKPGSTPGDAAFCFFCTVFFPPVWSIFFNTIFPLTFFSLFLLQTLLVMHLDMYFHSAELNVVAVTENVNTFLLV